MIEKMIVIMFSAATANWTRNTFFSCNDKFFHIIACADYSLFKARGKYLRKILRAISYVDP